MKQIVVHGHFYQPPRENPWTGQIDPQPSAAPFHDWNERVHAESYAPNAHARIPGVSGATIVNNFERLSFNIGPTLLGWMERADPETYSLIVEADGASEGRLGRGNAIAQAYHHTILPLSPIRDTRTQVRWGIADFRHHFNREPHGIWLPETAVDDKTLGVLIDEGLQFTILAPHQARRWRKDDEKWRDASQEDLDTRVAYHYMHRDGSGRSIALFFYDAALARAIAFGKAASSAETFLSMFAGRASEEHHLVHAATDGETYGHHHEFGDLGLAYALFVEAERQDVEVTNYSTYLEHYGTEAEVELHTEPTSWSCAHGVGRWSRDCGCSTGGPDGWNQAWRRPLRSALEAIRRGADDVYERLATPILGDPWGARDRYIQVVLAAEDIKEFAAREAIGEVTDDDVRLTEHLMELQRHSMSMFTSCGWFFNDIGGIETVQVLGYAARTLELLEALEEPSPRQAAQALLARAVSNDHEIGTGADVFASIGTR